MPDLVDKLRADIDQRIKELRPLVSEYERLESAAAALNDAGGLTAPKSTTSARRRTKSAASRSSKTARRGRPKGSGRRAQEALSIVQAQPGITIPEIAEKLQIKQNYLYRVMPDLAAAGQVKKRDRGWHPVPQSSPSPDEGSAAAGET